MKKLLASVVATTAAGVAATGVGPGAGLAQADSGNNSTLNVVGEPYAKAVAILRAQGVKATFGGSVGSDVPQAQCIVTSETVLASYKIKLNLDCTAAAQPQPQQPASAANPSAPASQTARPTPGAPGVVTVIPKQVG